MKTPDSRFYCPLISVGTITLDENESSHAVRVCRACAGDTLQLSDGVGHYADALIEVADAKACQVRVDTVIEATNPRPKVSLGIACLKDDALEEVVFHAAQTEIDKIIFLRTDFSQEPKNSDLKKTVRRAELKSLVSLKQSKKAWMTAIEGPVEFDKWLESYKGDLILCDIDGDRQLNLSASDNASASSDSSGANESSNKNADYFVSRPRRWILATRNRSNKDLPKREGPLAESRQYAPACAHCRDYCFRKNTVMDHRGVSPLAMT